jgi:hypothetical protein
MKLLAVAFLTISAILVVYGSHVPEAWAESTYNFIRTYKGSKDELLKELGSRFVDEMKLIKPGVLTPQDCKRGIELVKSKLTASDPITNDDLQKVIEHAKKEFTGK